jgi:hypothetical protein
MQTIFKKCPFKENSKLSKLFRLILRGLNLPVRSDTPQNNILRGLILRLTKFCGNNLKYEYFREFETEFKNILGCEFGDYMGYIRGKN